MNPNIYICSVLVFAGITFHFILKLAEFEKQGKIMSPWSYWRSAPYSSLTVVMSAYLFMGIQSAIGELTYSSAILTGIACNSIGDKLRARSEAFVSSKTDKPVATAQGD